MGEVYWRCGIVFLILLKKLIKYKIVRFRVRKNGSVFKFLLYKKKVNTENNRFKQFLFLYKELSTIDPVGWDFLLKNLRLVIFYIPEDDFLHFVKVLIDKELHDEARLLINDYIDFYGSEGLKYQLSVHTYCQTNGYCKQNPIHDTGLLIKNRVLLDCLKDQQIAIVGNGPSELGTGNGPTIDQHEYVVRFNNYKTEGFEEDYGKRTDIWVCCNDDDIRHRTAEELDSYKFIILELDFFRDVIRRPVYDFFGDIIKNYTHKVLFLNQETKQELVNALKVQPSTGLTMICYLLNLTEISKENLFGFSFRQSLEDNTGECDHYFEKRADYKSRHSLDVETEYIKSILN